MWSSEKEIPVSQLQLGMFVARLDCPWENTNFPVQGFPVKSPGDIQRLACYCNSVYIDVYKSHSEKRSFVKKRALKLRKQAREDIRCVKTFFSRHATEKYYIKSSFKHEVKRARRILTHLDVEIQHVLNSSGYLSKFDIKQVVDSTSDLVESVIRNPDAMVWLSQVQRNNALVYQHALRLAILGCLVGRQIGLNRFLLVDLTMALLMTSIGKSLLPLPVIRQYRYDFIPQDYKTHIALTKARLNDCEISGVQVLDIIDNYCERIDGSGYPKGKTDSQIPLPAQIAGLIEYFEIQIHPFDTKFAKPPSDAIAQLNRVKGKEFDAVLVEKFVQVLGIYPTGTLVELNDNRLAVVCSHNYEKRLRASVIPLTNCHGEYVKEFKILDLNLPNQWQLNDSKIRIRRGMAVNQVPAQIMEEANAWLFHQQGGVWDQVKHLVHDITR